MKTVLLINPKTVNKYYYVTRGWVDEVFGRLIRKYYESRSCSASHARPTTTPLRRRATIFAWPPITLFALQALFGKRCRTILFDEQAEEIDFSLEADLVCLTATTPQYRRAREIASVFKSRGIRTAIGGIHATCLPDECSADFDTVCVGEAEGYIDEMVRDLSAGRLKPMYRNETLGDLEASPFYQYDVVSGKHLPVYAINFSRGCNFNCEFCSVRSTVGKHRTRSVESVVRQIAQSGVREIWFTDASLTANIEKARALFKALIPLKVSWFSCIPLNIGQDEEMLDLMAESGCWLASTGFESLTEANIKECGKRQNRVEEYPKIIRSFHDRRIAIEGNFVFGFDGDTEDVFERTATFAVHNGIDLPEFYVLTPYPGTALYRRLLREGRIVDHDWSHYDHTGFHHLPVFEPKNMSRAALRDGYRTAHCIAYSLSSTIRRLWNAGTLSPTICMINYIFMRRVLLQGNLLPRGESYGTARELVHNDRA